MRSSGRLVAAMALLAACHPAPAVSALDLPGPHDPAGVILRGGLIVGHTNEGPVDVELIGPRIAAVGPAGTLVAPSVVEVRGRFLSPTFIDSHVHLAYDPVGHELALHGVAAVVDLAAPIRFLSTPHPLPVLASGPMLTAPGGYPLNDWGADGYGLACSDGRAAASAVDQLHDAGAGVIKLAITAPPTLSDESLTAATARAHVLGLKVVAHALRDEDVRRAVSAGVDVLAHTPVELLSPVTLASLRGRVVISTLAAFGGGPAALANLAALRAEGVTILYGTDLGNWPTQGIDPEELRLLGVAGLDGAAIVAAGTSVPAAYWGFAGLGAIAPGKEASVLILSHDPVLDPQALVAPEQVYLEGVRVE